MRINRPPGKRTIIYTVFVLIYFLPFNAGAVPPPSVVVEAARSGLPSFLESIPPAEKSNFGFAPSARIDQAVLGRPFKVYAITPTALSAYREGDTVTSLLSPTGMWFFPIVFNGDIRSILTVARVKGDWKAVAIGRASLAGELRKVMNRWPRSAGYDPFLVMVFQAKQYFFSIPQIDDYNLNPFNFNSGSAGKTAGYTSLTKLPRIVGKLQTAVTEEGR